MKKKLITVSSKRQITIPLEFCNKLGIGSQMLCYLDGSRIILESAAITTKDEVADRILADLISQGYSGRELLERFRALTNVEETPESQSAPKRTTLATPQRNVRTEQDSAGSQGSVKKSEGPEWFKRK